MKFTDIPLFPHSAYSVSIGWRFLEDHIAHEVKGGLELSPDFQRGHVWTESQQSAYVEYVLRSGRSGLDLWFNCPRYSQGNTNGPYVIVDGLQRLTAVRRFMRNEIPAFGHKLHEYSDRPDRMHCRFEWHVCQLETREDVLRLYLDFNAGGTPHAAEEIERVRRLLEAEKR